MRIMGELASARVRARDKSIYSGLETIESYYAGEERLVATNGEACGAYKTTRGSGDQSCVVIGDVRDAYRRMETHETSDCHCWGLDK